MKYWYGHTCAITITRVVIYLSWWCIMRVVFQHNNCTQNVSKWFDCLPNCELSADKYHSIGFNDLHVSISFTMKGKQTTHTTSSIPLSLLFHWFVLFCWVSKLTKFSRWKPVIESINLNTLGIPISRFSSDIRFPFLFNG